MIIHMNNTSSAAVGLRMEELRDTVGSVALGRVLTLVIVAKNDGGVRDGIKAAAGCLPVFWITCTRIRLDVIPVHIISTVSVCPLRFAGDGTSLAADAFV